MLSLDDYGTNLIEKPLDSYSGSELGIRLDQKLTFSMIRSIGSIYVRRTREQYESDLHITIYIP